MTRRAAAKVMRLDAGYRCHYRDTTFLRAVFTVARRARPGRDDDVLNTAWVVSGVEPGLRECRAVRAWAAVHGEAP